MAGEKASACVLPHLCACVATDATTHTHVQVPALRQSWKITHDHNCPNLLKSLKSSQYCGTLRASLHLQVHSRIFAAGAITRENKSQKAQRHSTSSGRMEPGFPALATFGFLNVK